MQKLFTMLPVWCYNAFTTQISYWHQKDAFFYLGKSAYSFFTSFLVRNLCGSK